MIPNRAPGSVWCLRREQFEPMVFTGPDETIHIKDRYGVLIVSRKDARLLAKRINQCLDATRAAELRRRKEGL